MVTFPSPWRRRLVQDGAPLGNLTRIFVEAVHAFYAERAAREGAAARCRRRTQPRDGSPADLHSSEGQPCTTVLNPPKAIRPGTNGMSGGIVDFFISAITRLLTTFRWAFDL